MGGQWGNGKGGLEKEGGYWRGGGIKKCETTCHVAH